MDVFMPMNKLKGIRKCCDIFTNLLNSNLTVTACTNINSYEKIIYGVCLHINAPLIPFLFLLEMGVFKFEWNDV